MPRARTSIGPLSMAHAGLPEGYRGRDLAMTSSVGNSVDFMADALGILSEQGVEVSARTLSATLEVLRIAPLGDGRVVSSPDAECEFVAP